MGKTKCCVFNLLRVGAQRPVCAGRECIGPAQFNINSPLELSKVVFSDEVGKVFLGKDIDIRAQEICIARQLKRRGSEHGNIKTPILGEDSHQTQTTTLSPLRKPNPSLAPTFQTVRPQIIVTAIRPDLWLELRD